VVAVDRVEVDTTDFTLAHAYLTRAHGEHHVRARRPDRDFVFRTSGSTAGELGLERLIYRAAAEVTAERVGALRAGAVVDGRYCIGDERFGRGDAMLYPYGLPLTVSWERIEMWIMRVPMDAVVRVASRLGVKPEEFRFDGASAVSAAMNRQWLATVGYVAQTLAGPDAPAGHPLLLANAVETVATTLITVFPNTTMGVDYTAGPGRSAPATVRRAVAYIDAHAADPITLEDIAAAAGVKVRGLQAAFARHRDSSPMAYLRRVRMQCVHRELLAADRASGDTVAGIARRWGFRSPGRFAADYQKIFGRTPGSTLRS
jgi:AraC-like DNA-binding protein